MSGKLEGYQMRNALITICNADTSTRVDDSEKSKSMYGINMFRLITVCSIQQSGSDVSFETRKNCIEMQYLMMCEIIIRALASH